jgi:hypothetical protein
MLPGYAANMAAPFSGPFARRFARAVTSISERWLGRHKTWLGYGLAIAAATVAAGVQAALAWPQAVVRSLSFFDALAVNRLALRLHIKSRRRLRAAPGARHRGRVALGPLLAIALMLLWAGDIRAVFWVPVIPRRWRCCCWRRG